jgi:hypothetical protein
LALSQTRDFKRVTGKKFTYESGSNSTVIEYVLVRRCDREEVRDVKVIGSVYFTTQTNGMRVSAERKCSKKEKDF